MFVDPSESNIGRIPLISSSFFDSTSYRKTPRLLPPVMSQCQSVPCQTNATILVSAVEFVNSPILIHPTLVLKSSHSPHSICACSYTAVQDSKTLSSYGGGGLSGICPACPINTTDSTQVPSYHGRSDLWSSFPLSCPSAISSIEMLRTGCISHRRPYCGVSERSGKSSRVGPIGCARLHSFGVLFFSFATEFCHGFFAVSSS